MRRLFRLPCILLLSFVLSSSIVFAGVGSASSGPAPSALKPAGTGGWATVYRALGELTNSRRVLLVGAHPDDEDTSIMALVARGMAGDAAYLSLSRGEGGQNLVGSELGTALGLLRTRELLDARAVDGGEQFFGQAIDFGYTRSLPETLGFWPHQVLLKDVVRIIRRFRPQVLISVFPSGGGGHGQHKAAGLVAHEAYPLAGNPSSFPELTKQGLLPWQPKVLYRGAWFDPQHATLRMSLDRIDPVTGHTLYQIAMESRSQHRSQGMGRPLPIGDHEARLIWERGAQGEGLFAGVDTHLAALAEELPAGAVKADATHRLASVEAMAVKTRAALDPGDLGAAVPALAQMVRELSAVDAQLSQATADRPVFATVRRLLAPKLEAARQGLAAAAGVVIDASAKHETVVPGGRLEVNAELWNDGASKVELGKPTVTVSSPSGWREASVSGGEIGGALAEGKLADWHLAIQVPADAPLTEPYFLRKPPKGYLYDWSSTPPAVRGEPFGPPPLTVTYHFDLAGAPEVLSREVVAVSYDRVKGEVRRPLRAVPEVEVAVTPDHLVWPTTDEKPRKVEVTLTSNASQQVAGELRVTPPTGWPAPQAVATTLAPGDPQSIEVSLAPAPRPETGRGVFKVDFVLPDGRSFGQSLPLIEHPHVRPTPYPVPAHVALSSFPLNLPSLSRVGYVRGAADRVPEALEDVGVPVELLTDRQLEERDLSVFPVIVIGSRAYGANAGLAKANARLLEYVKNGGVLIVQYQQYPFIRGNFAPYPMTIAHPHDRITDEHSPVKVLVPGSPVFNTPNKIAASDWKGWVQERGLYFAHTWAAAYQPLLQMKDPDEPPQEGGLLVAHDGQGLYVYTGIAFFRQLPAGVPGGYRLFANLLALGEHHGSARTGSSR